VRFAAGQFEVIVIGAGHAGCEAALASARLGCQTLLVTMNWDRVAFMYCNPSLGGPAKGHLVREIDALGGQMAITADRTSLQARRLNTGKGPAVQALRIQSDKTGYQRTMQDFLAAQPNLTIRQALVERLHLVNGRVEGIVTQTGALFTARAVVLTGGTFLRGRIILGDIIYDGGPSGERTSGALSLQLQEMGIELGRFKTGTSPRIQGKRVDFSRFIPQNGDPVPRRFSFLPTESRYWGRDPARQIPCWLGYTTARTHELIRANLHRAPLFTGVVEGIGPRRCPSIEDKVVRFAHRPAHQIFLEPEGKETSELYVAGLSTSMPEDVQIDLVHSIPGLEEVSILRPGYAIEYDYLRPHQLSLTLEVRTWPGLFCAGQINGTSGYEEAAAQGLLAGINAALMSQERDPFVLRRSEAYLGLLVDDLINREIHEPYRLLTSRSEYRLTLRSDNADLRLTEKGRDLGLVSEERWQRYCTKRQTMTNIEEQWRETILSPFDERVQRILTGAGSAPLRSGQRLQEILKRPEVSLAIAKELSSSGKDLNENVEAQQENLFGEGDAFAEEILEEALIKVKYQGYIAKQQEEIHRFNRMEDKQLPADLCYEEIYGLATEARVRLREARPASIGQAMRVSGVNPADVSVLLIYLEQRSRMTKLKAPELEPPELKPPELKPERRDAYYE